MRYQRVPTGTDSTFGTFSTYQRYPTPLRGVPLVPRANTHPDVIRPGPEPVRVPNVWRHVAECVPRVVEFPVVDDLDERVICRDCQSYRAAAHRCATHIAAGLQHATVSDDFAALRQHCPAFHPRLSDPQRNAP
jgi:hypothetical protein